MRVFAALLFAVSSAFAYEVTYPTNTQGWGTSGSNLLSWTRVNTDPLTFAAVLKSDTDSSYVQILNSDVDGTAGSINLNAPSGGWPTTGSDYRVNLAQDAQHLDSLLAQSPQFNFTGSGSSTGSSGTTTSTSTSTSSGTGTSKSPTSTLSGGSSTSSDTSTTPTSSSAGFLAVDARTGLLTAIAALTALITTLF